MRIAQVMSQACGVRSAYSRTVGVVRLLHMGHPASVVGSCSSTLGVPGVIRDWKVEIGTLEPP
jgi:hypothetical protein